MERTLNVLLAALVLAGSGCSSAITLYNPTNTSESTGRSDGVEGIVAAEAEKPETASKQCYCLKENEHILPDIVVETFLSLIFGEPKARLYPAYHLGHYEREPQIKIKMAEIEKQFYKTMCDQGYPPEQVLLYLTALSQPDSIVIKESVLKESVLSSNSFKVTLEHERIHHEFDKRPMTEKELLLSLHQELIRRDDIWRQFSQVIGLVFYTNMNYNNFGDGEFVAHLVGRAWYLVEDVKKEFPVEYEILSEIKKEAKVDARACNPSFEGDTTKKEELK